MLPPIVRQIAATVLPFAHSHPKISAAIAAFVASWILYGFLGKRYLGANDDFWPRIRRRVLPVADVVAERYGLYTVGKSTSAEFVGTVTIDKSRMRPQDDEPLDVFERDLVGMGYLRNPLAAYKTSPQGWHSDGSWSTRTGYIRFIGDLSDYALAKWHTGGYFGDVVVRFLQAVGDIWAIYQIHLTVYLQNDDDGSVRVWCYAHKEYNPLNPVVAWLHYAAIGISPKKGVAAVRRAFDAAGTDYSTHDND